MWLALVVSRSHNADINGATSQRFRSCKDSQGQSSQTGLPDPDAEDGTMSQLLQIRPHAFRQSWFRDCKARMQALVAVKA